MVGFNATRATDLACWLRKECIPYAALREGDIIVDDRGVYAVCRVVRRPPNEHETANLLPHYPIWHGCVEVVEWSDVDGNGERVPATSVVRILARDIVTLTAADVAEALQERA